MSGEMIENIVIGVVELTLIALVVVSVLRWARRRKRGALVPVAELMNLSVLPLPKNMYGATAYGYIGGRPGAILGAWHVVVPSAVALPEAAALALFHRDYSCSDYSGHGAGGMTHDPRMSPSDYGPEQPLQDPAFSKMYELRSKHPEIAQTIFSHPAVAAALLEQRVPIVWLILSCHNEIVTLYSALEKRRWDMRKFSSPEDVKRYAERMVRIMQAVERALAFEGDTAAAELRFAPHERGWPIWTRR